MAVEITKVDVWCGTIEDRPGALAGKLDALAQAGASIEFVLARRCPDRPGTGVVFLAPIHGAKHIKVALGAGLAKATDLFSLRLEGPDKPGMGALLTRTIGGAGINIRGLSAATIGRRCVTYVAFDTAADAKTASTVLKKALAGK